MRVYKGTYLLYSPIDKVISPVEGVYRLEDIAYFLPINLNSQQREGLESEYVYARREQGKTVLLGFVDKRIKLKPYNLGDTPEDIMNNISNLFNNNYQL